MQHFQKISSQEFLWKLTDFRCLRATQQKHTCSELTKQTLEKGVKYVYKVKAPKRRQPTSFWCLYC